MASRDDILTELGLVPTWRLRSRVDPGKPVRRNRREHRSTRSAPACCGESESDRRRAACAGSRRSNGATSRPTSTHAPPAAWRTAVGSPYPAWAIRPPTGCSSARHQEAKRTREGEPFVGQAGKLLDNMLAALGMKRGHNVYIANVLKCRPPNNRTPEPREVEACRPVSRPADRADPAQADRRARQERGHDTARDGGDDREPARACPPLP